METGIERTSPLLPAQGLGGQGKAHLNWFLEFLPTALISVENKKFQLDLHLLLSTAAVASQIPFVWVQVNDFNVKHRLTTRNSRANKRGKKN